MMLMGTVVTVQGNLFRVNLGGSLSGLLPCLSSACRLQQDAAGLRKVPPSFGDRVLCWFPGNAFCDGCIVGLQEESS